MPSQVADVAEQLGVRSMRPTDPEIYLGSMDKLRFDVNSIGRELKILDAERASLASWEVEALDRRPGN